MWALTWPARTPVWTLGNLSKQRKETASTQWPMRYLNLAAWTSGDTGIHADVDGLSSFQAIH